MQHSARDIACWVVLLVATGCSPKQDVAIRLVDRSANLPAWAVALGTEPWKRPLSAAREVDQRTLRATGSLSRVEHAFTRAVDGSVVATARHYRAFADERRVVLSQGSTRLELTAADIVWGSASFSSGETIAIGNVVQRVLNEDGSALEHLEVHAGGLEVTWLFRRPLGDNANLEIRVPFSGLLQRATKGASSGSGFFVGQAALVDADASRVLLPTEIHGGELVVRAPADILARARFPIAIDPLISPTYAVFAETDSDARIQSPSLIGGTNKSLVAWWQPRPDANLVSSARGDLNAVTMSGGATGSSFDVSSTVRAVLAGRQFSDIKRIATAKTSSHYVVTWYDPVNSRIDGVLVKDSDEVQPNDVRTFVTNVADAPFAIDCSGNDCVIVWRVAAGSLRWRSFRDGDSFRPASESHELTTAPDTMDVAASYSPFGNICVVWAASAGASTVHGVVDGSPLSLPVLSGAANELRAVFDGTTYVIGYVRSAADPSQLDGYARQVVTHRVSSNAEPETGVVSSGTHLDVRHFAMAAREDTTVVLYSDAGNVVRSSAMVGGTVTQGEDVDEVPFAVAVRPQVVTTGYSNPLRFHALWAFEGISPAAPEYITDWAYDARARDLFLDGATVRNAETLVDSGGEIIHLSHLRDPSRNQGFNYQVGVTRSGDNFLITWRSDHEATFRVKGAVLRGDGTLATPNGIDVPQSTGVTYPRSLPISADGWLLTYVKYDSNGGTVAAAQLDDDGEVAAVNNLTGPGFVYGPIDVAYGYGQNALAWKGFYIPRTDVITVVLLNNTSTTEILTGVEVGGVVGAVAIAAASGGFVLAYSRSDVSGSTVLCYRLLTSNGTSLDVGAEVVVPLSDAFFESPPQLRAFGGPDGSYMLAWLENGSTSSTFRVATTTTAGALNSPFVVSTGKPQIYALHTAQTQASRLLSWATVKTASTASLRGVTTQLDGSIFNEFGLPEIIVEESTQAAVADASTGTPSTNEWLFAYTELEHSPSFYGHHIVARFARTDHMLADDEDLDGVTVAQGDCDDTNPNVWASCSACQDLDNDGYWVGCDSYATVSGPDCDDAHAACAYNCTAEDRDGDGATVVPTCGTGADCNDDDPNVWLSASCSTCFDSDSDGFWVGCDAYVTIAGPDCDDGDELVDDVCQPDQDGDGLSVIDGDCNDTNPNVWTSCGTCVDSDADDHWVGCDVYRTISGPDCDDETPSDNSECVNLDRDDDGTSIADGDCNDESPYICPYCGESCATAYDDDCNGLINEDDGNVWDGFIFFADKDGDTFGSGDAFLIRCSEDRPNGFVLNSLDCDDDFSACGASCSPSRREKCDGYDNDCSGTPDDLFPAGTDDFDGDGYTDCTDNCPSIANSSQADADADGVGDACEGDIDGDGFVESDPVAAADANSYPGAVELCDGRDNDGDGLVDEGTGCARCP